MGQLFSKVSSLRYALSLTQKNSVSEQQAFAGTPKVRSKNMFIAFNFTNTPKEGYITVPYDQEKGAPKYHSSCGFGFVEQDIHSGITFRIEAAPGAYEIIVKTTIDMSDIFVSISGMQADELLKEGCWDAAGMVAKQTIAKADGDQWTYCYANGMNDINIEIEPKHPHLQKTIGFTEIVIKRLPQRMRSRERLPTIYLLGDSTVKSYTFDEAPMSGWGQVIGNLFDESKVKVTNYSMGGRSFRNAYAEGRLNDILMTGFVGDYMLIQFGHNDEREDEHERFGRGSTEEMYETYVKDLYIPAIRARGMIPILVTPMSRVNGAARPGHIYMNSFKNRRFPDILKRLARELQVPVIDLNSESAAYYNEIGVEATTAMFMSIEAGETPGKTNDGSYANGHPANKVDGTHYKEALAKQFARMITTQLAELGRTGDAKASELASYLKNDVKQAIASGDWSIVYPEVTEDTSVGRYAYYRNQIEKLLQLGALSKDQHGFFHPDRCMSTHKFITALCTLLGIDREVMAELPDGDLNREVMASLLYDAYAAKFTAKPRYMTDYNGNTNIQAYANYDPNLDTGAQGIAYNPLLPFEKLTDVHLLSAPFKHKVKAAYELGLIRAEDGIVRGKYMNGTALEPRKHVTREKAAKALYFIWVLSQPVKGENHIKL